MQAPSDERCARAGTRRGEPRILETKKAYQLIGDEFLVVVIKRGHIFQCYELDLSKSLVKKIKGGCGY